MNTVVRLGAALLLVHLAGCDAAGPTAPNQSPIPAPSQSPNPPVPSVTGRVANIAGFFLPGVVVAGVDSDGTMTSAATDRFGYYELRAPSTGTMIVRASKEGYVSSENRVDLPQTGPVNFVLDFTEQSAALRGEYRVTLAADAACVQLPAEVRTRNYDASLTPLAPHYYEGRLRSGTSSAGSFAAWVDSGVVNVSANDSESYVHETLDASRSLTVFFSAGGAPVGRASFTVPMVGTFEYCADVNPNNQYVCRAPLIRCTSSNHTFTLTRR